MLLFIVDLHAACHLLFFQEAVFAVNQIQIAALNVFNLRSAE
jgi:hypothetical protein